MAGFPSVVDITVEFGVLDLALAKDIEKTGDRILSFADGVDVITEALVVVTDALISLIETLVIAAEVRIV